MGEQGARVNHGSFPLSPCLPCSRAPRPLSLSSPLHKSACILSKACKSKEARRE
jgi:hypothetical protein